jgi:uncharacterized protein (TIGR00661 family)
MRLLFLVEGEGRGHISQALAAREICEESGYEICGTLVSMHKVRQLPAYFTDAFPGWRPFKGPDLAYRNDRDVDWFRTVARGARRFPLFIQGAGEIDRAIRELRPDVVVNFFCHNIILLQAFFPKRAPILAVSHQNMLRHPTYPRPHGRRFEAAPLKVLTWTASNRCHKLALSYYPARDMPLRRIIVSPPLLRRQVRELKPTNGDYLLVYLLNHGYRADIERWHRSHLDVPIHCFYDRPGASDDERTDGKLWFHRLHGRRFLEMMAGCRAVVCTGGFQVVSEAAYLGKPVLMIPTDNMPEQHLNAVDAMSHGLGKYRLDYKLDRALDAEPLPDWVRVWFDRAAERFRYGVETAAAEPARRRWYQRLGRRA